MKRISVEFEQSDKVDFLLDDDPALGWLADFQPGNYQRLFVFIDANVRATWGSLIEAALLKHSLPIFWLNVEARESSKSLSFYPTALEFLETNGAGRYDLVLAVGGGIVIDLVSFLASTYMRGLPLYVVATTLIGQMDASTAGKTCLNTGSAKNVLGTFYYPRVVYNNIQFLTTNTPYYLRQGFSETFKYGLLGAPDLIELLRSYREDPRPSTLMRLVERAIETRVSIRKRDPLASNLGHTFGHALEKLSNFEVLHGDAISAGTVMALRFAEQKKLIQKSVVDEIVATMRELNLNVCFESSIDADEMVNLMLRDKKSSSDTLHLVLIKNTGEPFLTDGSSFYASNPAEVRDFLQEYLAHNPHGIPNCAEWLKRDELYAAEVTT